MNTLEDRFIKIVKEMDAEVVAAQSRITDLQSKLRIANFPIEQATNCGKCGEYKHTPWKDEEYGYVCATCIVEIAKEKETERWEAQVAKFAQYRDRYREIAHRLHSYCAKHHDDCEKRPGTCRCGLTNIKVKLDTLDAECFSKN